MSEIRPMEIIFQRGDSITGEGDTAGKPVLMIEDGGDEGLGVDIRADLPDDVNGDSRTVNFVIPLDDFLEAVTFLRGQLVSKR